MLRKSRKGFTLVELLVVIAIIGILIALLLPAVQAAREAARRMQCTNNLKQLALACHNYHDSHKVLPALGMRGMGQNGGWRYSGFIGLLPYIEQTAMYDGIMAEARPSGPGLPTPWSTGGGAFRNNYWKQDMEAFICPSAGGEPPERRESPSLTSYRFCVGDDYHQNHFLQGQSSRDNRGVFQTERWLPLAGITDGTSNTILLGEAWMGTKGPRDLEGGVATNQHPWNPASCQARYDPVTKQLTGDVRANFRPPGGRLWDGRPYFVGFCTMVPPNGPSCHWGGVDGNEHMGTAGSNHPGGANVAMSDGSIHFVTETIDAGNQSANDVATPGGRPSPWGVWGALGSRAGGESASLQ
jgi:prepilin-type N-terminal cleavage/methylation domain-containing protein/prepilin-type processing-associated H-X9-DG protein